jgi:hypothetical protein
MGPLRLKTRSVIRREVGVMKIFGTIAVLLLSTSVAMATLAGLRTVVDACRPDVKQYCHEVPGGGRIKACMKAHIGELSEPCKEALFHYWLND